MSRYFTTHDTRIGRLLLLADADGLCHLSMAMDLPARLAEFSPKPMESKSFFAEMVAAIDAYLAGRAALHLPVHITRGTALQRAVWQALAAIPYGETISYTALAERVGAPRAVRAVASACAANPLPLAIPCHRVIAKNGALGGFSLGSGAVKAQLLALESQASPSGLPSLERYAIA